MRIDFLFPGEPKAIQSARFCNRGGFIRSYQPKANTDWKGYIRVSALSQLPDAWNVIDAPVEIDTCFMFSAPRSARKRDLAALQEGAVWYKTTKPDLTDNLCKGMIDALTGIVWRDDALICRVSSRKIYTQSPGISLTVRMIDAIETPLFNNTEVIK